MAARATAYLESENELLLPDLMAAETVYVLESFYEAPNELLEAWSRASNGEPPGTIEPLS